MFRDNYGRTGQQWPIGPIMFHNHVIIAIRHRGKMKQLILWLNNYRYLTRRSGQSRRLSGSDSTLSYDKESMHFFTLYFAMFFT